MKLPYQVYRLQSRYEWMHEIVKKMKCFSSSSITSGKACPEVPGKG